MDRARMLGIRACDRFSLPKTAKVIGSGVCYPAIMQALAEEAGLDRAVAALKEVGEPTWVYFFARDVPNLTEAHLTILVDVMVQSGDVGFAYLFARDVPNLTEAHLIALRRVGATA